MLRFDFGPERSPYRAPVEHLKQATASPALLRNVEHKRSPSSWWTAVGDGKHYWLVAGDVYVTSEGDLKPGDVAVLIAEQDEKKRRRIERAHAASTRRRT